MNNFNQTDGYQQSTGYPNMDNIFNPGKIVQNNVPQLNRNYTIVTSLQEALSKQSPYNSRGIYLHQDGEYEFEIFTDVNGRKTYEVFKRVVCTNSNDAMSIPRNEYEELKTKIKKLEETVYGKPANNTSDGNATM